MNKISFRKLASLIHPIFLLGGFLLFGLGVGISHYLGHPLNWTAYLLGQGCILFLQLSVIFLTNYYNNLMDNNPVSKEGGKAISRGIVEDEEGKYRLTTQGAILLSVTTLFCAAFSSILLLQTGYLNPSALAVILIAFLVVLFYAAPSIRLVDSGYGELSMAIFMTNLVPAFAFTLQVGNMHRLIAMATFPLTMLYLALSIALSLPNYLSDLRKGRRTLLIRIGWQRAMNLHNILILVGYVLIVISMTTGLPWRIAWPSLLSFPFGIFQIWQMNQIAEGARPRWSLLSSTAITTLGLTAYLLAFSFWIS